MYPIATAQHVRAALPAKTGRGAVWVIAGLAVFMAMVVLAIIAYVFFRPPGPCGANCPPPHPPQALALPPAHQYRSSALGYSLAYGNDYMPSKQDARSIGWSLDNGAIDIMGERANGRSDQQIVQALASGYPDATLVFPLAGAELGYTPGAGAVYQYYDSPANGPRTRKRVSVEAVVKQGIAIWMKSVSPFVRDTGQQGFPFPAQMDLTTGHVSDAIGNTITWPEDVRQ